MNIQKIFITFALLNFALPGFAQMTQASIDNERRLVSVAEHEIMKEFILALSPSVRGTGGALELAVGLIGISRSSVGADALLNLLGLRLDGAGSEELGCQILIHDRPLLRRLERMKVERVSEHCQASFMEIKKRELAQVSDVRVDQVCRSETEIRNVRDDFIKAVKSKAGCEQ